MNIKLDTLVAIYTKDERCIVLSICFSFAPDDPAVKHSKSAD